MEITGKVYSGLGEGAFFTSLDWVQQQSEKMLGFRPYPGTLNVQIQEQQVASMQNYLKGIEGKLFQAPSENFCNAVCYPVFLQSKFMGALILPEKTVHPPHYLEIISPVMLKKELALKDGDEIIIKL